MCVPETLNDLRPTPGPIIAARPEHARGIAELRDRLARWLQGRGIDQWREGEFSEADILREVARGEWWVIEDPRDPRTVLASAQIIWADPRV